MGIVSIIKQLSVKAIWLGSVLISVLMSEGIVIPLSLLLKKRVDPDFLIAGFVTSLVVASCVTAMLIYMMKSIHKREIQLRQLEEKSKAENTQLRERLWKHAYTSLLTGLPNRQLFTRLLRRGIRKCSRSDDLLAVIAINLGSLKEVNETLGHRFGDKLLADAARRITDRIRGSDTVAHLGGDEFAVILSRLAESGHVDRIASDLMDSLKRPYHIDKEAVYLLPSMGIAICPADSTDAETLLTNASQAMNLVRREGGNSYSYFAPSSREERLKRLRLIRELHAALERDEFRLYFQPVIDLRTGEILKGEALIRWQHPVRGLVSPADFIPLAEEIGLIHEIGDWVFKESLEFGKHWSELAGRTFKVSVNLSPVQFKEKGLDDRWLDYLSQAGVSGNGIIIEITESILMHDGPDVHKALLRFRDAGIEVAIDDFGTGYSSLSYLKQYHIDYLKIDRSFIQNIAQSASDMALSEAIVSMAHKLGLKVIAEGIETGQQKDLLSATNCDFGQGYLFSEPLPPQLFEEFLQSRKYEKNGGDSFNEAGRSRMLNGELSSIR